MFGTAPRWHKHFTTSDCPLVKAFETCALSSPSSSLAPASDPFATPLATAQNFTNSFLSLDRNTSSTCRRGSQQPQQPFTHSCDEFFAGELSQLDNTFPAREAALVACVHLLRREQAHGQLLLTKRAVHADDLVRDRLAVYLRCLVLAHGATGGDVVSDAEATAARDLLSVHMHAPSSGSDAEERIPPVWSLLSVVSNDVVRAY